MAVLYFNFVFFGAASDAATYKSNGNAKYCFLRGPAFHPVHIAGAYIMRWLKNQWMTVLGQIDFQHATMGQSLTTVDAIGFFKKKEEQRGTS